MKLNIYFKYIKQVIVHRWFVAVECWKYGLWFAPFLHDNSKFSPSEFKAYANYFMGDKEAWKERFSYAWNHHWKCNKHHGLYWIVEMKKLEDHFAQDKDDPSIFVEHKNLATYKVLKMPARYAVEMYCDWVAAGKAYTGKNDVSEWYEKNQAGMILHHDTRIFVESLIYSLNDKERKMRCQYALQIGYGPYFHMAVL